jgi:hypothetical protein
MLFGLTWGLTVAAHDANAGPFLLAQNGAPTAAPDPGSSPPPASSPPRSSVPVVQKSYLFEWFYVPLLIVAALTIICRSSNRS